MSTPYDFNKREDSEYSHSFDYLGGVGLGKAEVNAERDRAMKRGKYDLTPVDAPPDLNTQNEVIKIAQMLHASPQRAMLLKKINETKDKRMEFVWNKNHQNNAYFEWALHCIDREVPDWTSIKPSSESSHAPKSEIPVRAPINVSDWVDISDVQARPELNGKRGIVTTVSSNGRVEVEFPDISQTVSLSLSKCTKSDQIGPKAVEGNRLPQGLKVEVANLTSEQGKLLNGSLGYIVGYSRETERYTLRCIDVGLKSLKAENLHVCLPPHWEEHVDPSSGETFFRNMLTSKVSWEHPILGNRKRKTASTSVESEFVNRDEDSEPEESGNEFDRSEFLEGERKRLRLDKKRSGIKEDTVRKLMNLVRQEFGISEPSPGAPMFEGTPAELLGRLNNKSDKDLVIGLELVFQDLCKLKFNKRQIAGFAEHLDQILEDKRFSNEMIDWLTGALKIAMPVSYTVI